MIGPGNVQYTYAQLEGIWNQAGGSPQNAAMAAAISLAESGGNSAAYGDNTNGTQDRGLWQINSIHGSQSSFDVMTNARAAVAISNNGTNWRPWCTAYADAACGTKGGGYLGSGAPFYKFLQGGVPPDLNAPINGTNAAGGVTTSTQNAQLTGFHCNWWESAVFPECVGINAAGGALNSSEQMVVNIIEGAIKAILNPFIQLIAGIMGVTGGGILMVGGAYLIVKQTETYQRAQGAKQQAAGLALMAVAPEAELAEGATQTRSTQIGGSRITTTRRGPVQQTPPTNAELMRAEAYRYNSYANYMREQRMANT